MKIKKWVEEAFKARSDKSDKINNSREQIKYNKYKKNEIV